MLKASQCTTLQEVDWLIAEIGRHDDSAVRKAESGNYTAAERAKDSRLNAACEAVERRAELGNMIHNFQGAMLGHS